jgi:hypothetical protein
MGQMGGNGRGTLGEDLRAARAHSRSHSRRGLLFEHWSLRGTQTELAIRLLVVREPSARKPTPRFSEPVCPCPTSSLAQSSPSPRTVLGQSSDRPLGPRHSSDALCVSACRRSRSLRLAQHQDAEGGTGGPFHDRGGLIPIGSDGSCRVRLSRSQHQGGSWPDMSCVVDACARSRRRANFAPIAHRLRTDLARRGTA